MIKPVSGIYWIFFVVLITIAGCKDECDDFNNYHPVYDQWKPYLFKEGTYWIYQNSVTGQTDSEYVSRVYNALDTSVYIKYTCGVNYSVADEIRMTHKSTELQNDSLVWYCLGGSGSFLGADKKGLKNAIFLMGDKIFYSPNGCLSYKGLSQQLSVGANIFYSVDCFSKKRDLAQCQSVFSYTTDFYFAANYGIIKKVEYNTPNGTQEWNLIRCKIVQ